jgi:hypothetical protein
MGNKVTISARSGLLKIAVRIGFSILGVAALAWLLDHVGWQQIAHALSMVGVGGALVLIILGVAENIMDSAALRAAVPNKIGLYRILSYNGIGAVVNSLVPGDLGEVAKGSLIRKHCTLQDAITGTVLWNYIFKVTRPTVAFAAAATAWLLGHGTDSMVATIVLGTTLVAFAPYLALKLLVHKGMARIAVRFFRKLRVVRKDPEQLERSAMELDEKIRSFRQNRPGDYFRVFGFQCLARIVAWITLFAALRLTGLDYSFGLASLIYAGFSVASYVVMILPARLGVSEGAGYLIFSWYGLDGGMGVIVYVLLRIKALVTNGIPAIFRPR